MQIAIITNLTNGIGLEREFHLLRQFLEQRGHAVQGIQYDQDAPQEILEFDLAISLETVARHLVDIAPIHWLFPNPEWTKRGDLDLIGRYYSKILCKTKEATRIFSAIYGDRVHHVGFLAHDQFDPSVTRLPKFLHIGGNSSFRGTQSVLDAWKWKKNDDSLCADLTIVSKALLERPEIPGVTYLERVTEEELRQLQNSHRFHLYPAGTEGFGHALREGMSVNASILTTDAAPMNELKSVHTIPPVGKSVYNLADVYEVSALDVHIAVKEMLDLEMHNFHEDESRDEFLRGNEFFTAEFSKHIDNFVPQSQRMAVAKTGGKLRIAFIGNFEASESTENMILWALEEALGHHVDKLQENRVNLSQLKFAGRNSDVLIWVRTPGWLKVDDSVMMTWLESLKIPSVSVHLDKFWGIPEREALIGVHPFWKTKFVFTADGSRQDDFQSRGVNHFWMKPAVSEVYCHPGIIKEEFRCDVGFVGAREYHAEYPFRSKMVDFLSQTYGSRFKHVTGVRGHELNNVYASMKVVVGDCIFAGTPFYWSDRVPETAGRYGLLIHPFIEGMDILTPVYMPQDLNSLHEVIESVLGLTEKDRKEIRRIGAECVKSKDTWSIRMQEILEIVTA